MEYEKPQFLLDGIKQNNKKEPLNPTKYISAFDRLNGLFLSIGRQTNLCQHHTKHIYNLLEDLQILCQEQCHDLGHRGLRHRRNHKLDKRTSSYFSFYFISSKSATPCLHSGQMKSSGKSPSWT